MHYLSQNSSNIGNIYLMYTYSSTSTVCEIFRLQYAKCDASTKNKSLYNVHSHFTNQRPSGDTNSQNKTSIK